MITVALGMLIPCFSNAYLGFQAATAMLMKLRSDSERLHGSSVSFMFSVRTNS